MKTLVGASILNTDLANLQDECTALVEDGIDFLHIDVMDGHFVADITFGSLLVSHLRKYFKKPVYFDVHLMVSEPQKFVKKMAEAGADRFTFHFEVVKDYVQICRSIREHGMQVGCAINPSTDVEQVMDLIDQSAPPDCFLIMTVVPGKGGQKLIEKCLNKVRKIREIYGYHVDIEVDGGVNIDNVATCASAGANLIVSGTGIVVHAADKRSQIITEMKKLAKDNFEY